MKLVEQGAEAKIYVEGNTIIKDRFKKTYRHEEIDDKLRISRTKREAKVLDKLRDLMPVPEVFSVNGSILKLEKIEGQKLRDCLENAHFKFCKRIGEMIAVMHNEGIIHGDLTTSNMILNGSTIYFIDFGLSFFSSKVEDMAVDLHLLDRALESRHHAIYEKCMLAVWKGYRTCTKFEEVKFRFEQVQERGRNKVKY